VPGLVCDVGLWIVLWYNFVKKNCKKLLEWENLEIMNFRVVLSRGNLNSIFFIQSCR